uniref:Major facilitator superfamily (MFS) profile domain-containing protein n=1 Tax=Kwoniella bestiolae CBS 10118 TaxID=1296100 RepID=A0A1B9G1I8_9TREE|nr:hypothetical protein I302_04697 [Kwoniella bestiolae CBS 10118]OCF24887.1 hypothetical protein I302_04697 [Kwoniella bestiolae CBS 10118]
MLAELEPAYIDHCNDASDLGYIPRGSATKECQVGSSGKPIPSPRVMCELLMSSEKIGFWITGPYVISQFLMMTTFSQNIAGRTKKSVAQALTFVSYCLGFLVGPQFFWASSAPDYKPGLYTTAVCFVLIEVILICWFFWARSVNKARDRVVREKGMSEEAAEAEGRSMGEQDLTDRQVS